MRRSPLTTSGLTGQWDWLLLSSPGECWVFLLAFYWPSCFWSGPEQRWTRICCTTGSEEEMPPLSRRRRHHPAASSCRGGERWLIIILKDLPFPHSHKEITKMQRFSDSQALLYLQQFRGLKRQCSLFRVSAAISIFIYGQHQAHDHQGNTCYSAKHAHLRCSAITAEKRVNFANVSPRKKKRTRN